MRNLISSGLKRLKRQDSKYPQGDKSATVIAVATVKGGVGKTTSTINIAAALASTHQKRVLLIDLDAQGHCSTSLSALVPDAPVYTPISEVLLADDQKQVLDSAVSTSYPNLDITPADSSLAEAEGLISQKIGKEMLLRDALAITRTHYDVILIDCPPNKGNLTLNALLAADYVLIPTDLSPLAVQGADELIDAVLTVNERLHHKLDVLGVVLTRVDGRNVSLNDEIRKQIKDAWGDYVLSSEIGVNTQLSQAQHEGQPIFAFAPKSRGAAHYSALAQEIYNRIFV